MVYDKNYIRKKHPFNCSFCGEEFYAYKKGKATQKFCSPKCSNEAQRNGKEYECESCGKRLIRTPGNIKNKIYCSKKCADEGKRGVSINSVEKVIFTCEVCLETKKVLPCYAEKRMVCSTVCRDKLLSIRGTVTVKCTNCNKDVKRRKSRIRGKMNFCSDECMITYFRESDFMKGENSPNFIGGGTKYYGPDWSNQRRKARTRDGYCCQDCGISEKELDRELDVHHITPFRFFEDSAEANRLENLVCLCADCHRKRHLEDLNPANYDKSKVKIPFGSKLKKIKKLDNDIV
ncbi:5-methylcytosine-specific restriction endonuclease McrA/endogenous inhibitor of DNA gyrase (YacG/DUF329 family) [Bacillus fengqiuensis]|nr:5-methylcytosine-specific restriction endonuclease McrA/endogenous inhibitor of DNA gyrase (YacG/DUF329 family) [Bacillus fengqiuensis]